MESLQTNESLSDTILIRSFLDGDNSAFDLLYARYRLPLYSYLNRLLAGHREQVDDLFQQTWVKAVRSLPRYTDRTRFLAWLCRIAHNLTMDYYRSGEQGLQTLPECLASEYEHPAEAMQRSGLDAALQDAIGKLPPEQQEVVRLRNANVPFKEIAQRQHITINTALGRMHYAILNLRKLLADFL